MFVRNFLPQYPQPDADAIENLSMAVIVDQKRLGGGSHSTVGTITDIYTRAAPAVLARRASRTSGYANAFSFNDPQGMCPECNGLGQEARRRSRTTSSTCRKSLERGRGAGAGLRRRGRTASYAASRLLRQRQEAGEVHQGRDGPAAARQGRASSRRRSAASRSTSRYEGIIAKFERAYIRRDLKTLSRAHAEGGRRRTSRCGPCPLCKGARLSQAALALQDQRPQHRRAARRWRSASCSPSCSEIDEPGRGADRRRRSSSGCSTWSTSASTT